MKQGYSYFKAGILFLLFSFSSTFIYSQQFLVNTEWDYSSHGLSFFERSIVKTDANNNVYSLGSTLTATGYDWILVKVDDHGDSLWTTYFDGDNETQDIAMDMYLDEANGGIFIVGGSEQNGSDSLDACIARFQMDSGDEDWRVYLSGTNSFNDLYTSITTDGSGNLLLGGVLGTSTQGYDYLYTKCQTDGTVDYSSSYDYLNYDDVVVKITYNADKDWAVLSGASQPADTSWDYFLISYDVATGSYQTDERNFGGYGALNRPSDALYYNGFYYITGSINNPSTGGYDIKTVCLDTALQVVWDHSWNGIDSLEDHGNAVVIDTSNGDVYITGYTSTNTQLKNTILIKYDSSGNEKFVKMLNGTSGTDDKGTDIELRDGRVYVGGYSDNTHLNAVCFDTSGAFLWQRISSIGLNVHVNLVIDGTGAVILGAPLSYTLFTEKYSVLELTNDPVVDTAGVPQYKENEIIISFNPSKVNTAFIDDTKKEFADIEEVVDSVLIDQMEDKLGITLRNSRFIQMVKIVKQLTVDTVSATRHGYSIKIPKFWATLTMTLPPAYDELEACDSLNTLLDIYYAEINGAFRVLGANDNYYNTANDQSSLHPSGTYPNAHINIDSAWSRTVGKDIVKVGILDNGVRYSHEDLGTAVPGSLSGSNIDGGYNFKINANIQNYLVTSGFYDHGTMVTGIIGAQRDNTIGIAGIAGGDPDSAANVSQGVKLYDMIVCCNPGSPLSTSYVTDLNEALFEGAVSGTDPYNGLHIMNMSLGTTGAFANASLRQHILFARDNGVILVGARGHGSSQDSTLIYPAVYPDELILNVGGSGTDGHYKKNTNGSASGYLGATANAYTYISKNMDFTAPQAYENIYSLDNNTNDNSYLSFGGTSAAAAHVSGVASLMLSYHNSSAASDQNLSIEDVEHILQYTATDDILADSSSTYGYDKYSGFGRINGGKALQVIEKPYYQVLHFTAWLNSSDMVQVANNVQNGNGFRLNDWSFGAPNLGASVDVDVYKITGVSQHGQWISPTGVILGHWIRNSYSDAFDTCYTASSLPQVDAYKFAGFDYFNPDSAQLFGYLYNAPGLGQWFPQNPTTGLIKLSYTVHTYDSSGQTIVEELEDINISLYPNPAKDFVNLQFTMPQNGKALIRVLDMNGRVVLSLMNEMIEGGIHTMQVPVQSLQQGLYFFEIAIDNKTTVKKFIKLE